jgi:long-chain acyl-CoA synthetase
VNLPVHTGANCVRLNCFDLWRGPGAEHRITWWKAWPQNGVMASPVARMEKLRRNPVTAASLSPNSSPGAVRPHHSHEAAYGLSETHTVDTAMPVDAIRWGTQGKPVPGNQIRIVDPDTGAPLPAGTVGEITILGPGNFKGYWNKPEATA